MRIGSLFSGYGGLDLAVQAVLGGEVAWHVEYDKAPSRILNHHFPGVPNYGDVTKLDFTTVEPVDVITGGYPCQPFSHAGLRKGTNDDRHLWPHVLRAICEMGPRLAILENVRGHLSLGFDTVLADLADVGWSARWGVVRASDAGAPHQRARLFIVAYPSHLGLQWGRRSRVGWAGPADDDLNAADADGNRRQRVGGLSFNGTSADSAKSDSRTFADAQLHGLNGDTLRRGTSASQEERRVRQPQGRDSQDAADAAGTGRVRAPQHEDDGADSGRGRRHDLADLGKGGGAPAADACDCQQQIDQGHDGLNGERTPLGRGAVVTAGARGNGVDSVGALAGSHAARGSAASCDCGAPPYADLARLERSESSQQHELSARRGERFWGDYGPAIARWERVIGRSAPRPTEPGRTGAPRLSPAFVEWMMGLPAGWVTDPAIGISRNDQLKALGNGVVPQQAALALDALLARCD